MMRLVTKLLKETSNGAEKKLGSEACEVVIIIPSD